MTAAFGFPDFNVKASPGLDLIGTFNINTGGTQSIDISALVQPSHEGVIMYWVASLASLGQGILVQIGASFNSLGVTEQTRIFDGGTYIDNIPGALLTSVSGNITTLLVNIVPGDPAPVTGVLMVLGINGSPLIVNGTRHSQIGHGQSSGTHGAGAGAIATILAAPAPGFYYRLKMITWGWGTPAAAHANFFVEDLGGVQLLHGVVSTVADQQFFVPMDIEWDGGVRFNNASTITINGTVLYELWQI